MTGAMVGQAASVAAQPSDFKAAALLSYDLAMMATASRYDLDDLAERTQSHRHLVHLFMRLAKLADADLFVEAGAKEASASRRAKGLLPGARVVAFEANPFTYNQFAADNQAQGIEYLNLALTESPGVVTMSVHRDEHGQPLANGQASLLQRDKEQKDRDRGFHQITVDGVTLDGFFADHDYSRAALWVDVEGACRFVLSGARELLSKTAVVMIEVEDANYWGADHWLREQVVSHMYDLGLVPVARDFENVNQWSSQYNIVFVQAALLDGGFDKLRNEITRFRSRAYMPKRRKPQKPVAPPAEAAPTANRLRERAIRAIRALR